MIHKISSSLRTFKSLNFGRGLNLLVADKSVGATIRDTRNRAGKTSLIEIIHFLMAARFDKDSLFANAALAEESFSITFDLAGNETTVERTGDEPKRMRIIGGPTDTWPIQPEPEKDTDYQSLKLEQWEKVLGSFMFGLTEEITKQKFSPTFRMLFPYFARRNPEGFAYAHTHFAAATKWSWQVALTYLLGLDWTIPRDWQCARHRQERLGRLKKEIGEGALAHIVGKAASLRTELVNLNQAATRLRTQLQAFNVHPEYRSVENEASAVTKAISQLANDNTIDRQAIADLEEAMASEQAPAVEDLRRLYEEAGIVLPDLALRRFDEVRAFHESVVRNRQNYLQGELISAKERIRVREARQTELSARLSELMQFLHSHDALDVFTRLQAELARIGAQAEVVKSRYDLAKEIEGESAQLKIDFSQLLLRLQRDYTEQEERLKEIISTYSDISGQLYRDPGTLTIEETENGPEFNVQIQGERSAGISNMQIFTFDMTLITVLGRRGLGPGFLVHDSHLFDPVDGRQVGTALAVGLRLAEELGFQYIVTLNSDELSRIEVPDGIDLDAHILPTRLTDDTDDGGLFGFRFD